MNTLKKANFNPNSDRLAVSSTTGICSKPDQEKCDKPTEHSNQERAEKLAFLLSELKETGYDPIVYASPKTWNDYYVTGEHNFSSYPLWVAHWTNSDKPMIPKDWKDAGKSYDYWNNTCDGTVDGISGKVCLDRTQDDRKDILQKIAQEFSKVKDSTLDISLDFENIENYLN
ncbi:GH25 family lysozyme [Wolbachia endosymbiont of Ctenocephalides felis wCfeT]|uniref:GH25 family lysozyme n=1 Tax=Wolbachia endosymbiont of Ctenocephalides felis wCfeT TaxID=2732593 RepID=UPI001FE4BF98|nr:GH25 family lysozyme [Wolbachia endosymbiont of Ctenocephalides felis wCfeT]